MSTPNDSIRELHSWSIDTERTENESGPEVVGGQTVTVTRPVKKTVSTRMVLKQPTRREIRAAELHYGSEFNRFVRLGFLPRSVLINEHLDLTGGVMSKKEQEMIAKLSKRHVDLEGDQVRAVAAQDKEAQDHIEKEMYAIRSEITNINNANESVFSQTAEAKAQGQLVQWFAFYLTHIERNGRLVHYFEGEEFKEKEEHMWKLEESNDPFYQQCIQQILTYAHFLNKGASKPEHFQQIDVELKKQLESRKATEEAAKKAADPVVIDPVAPVEPAPATAAESVATT